MAKEIKIETLGEESNIIPVNTGNHQDSFLYGKSIEAIDYNTGIKNKPTTNACLIQSGTQTISNNSQTTLTGLSVVSGDSGMTATSNRITITSAGTYLISISIFDATGSATGVRNAVIVKNGSNAFIARRIASSTSSLDCSASYPLVLVAGDYLELASYQDSGVSMTASTSFISAVKIA